RSGVSIAFGRGQRPGHSADAPADFRWALSIANRRSFVATPPFAEKPPGLPPAASTRWHGTRIGSGFLPSAWPTARAERGAPIRAAISPYESVVPDGILRAAS